MAREANGRSNFSSGTGQFLCVDGFGGVSPEEKAAGLPGHGEAHLVEWEGRVQNGQLVLSSQLPHTQENITRTMTLAPGENVVIYETTLESQLGLRPSGVLGRALHHRLAVPSAGRDCGRFPGRAVQDPAA